MAMACAMRRVELPPRARRILYAPLPTSVCLGTTSACAENTTSNPKNHETPRNYLRVRGEYPGPMPEMRDQRELPPRARRIRITERPIKRHCGTTSACAENTTGHADHRGVRGNYLRVRGEYACKPLVISSAAELPPRARRILFQSIPRGFNDGTTSACAENTRGEIRRLARNRNYLRVRGEYNQAHSTSPKISELPPRARRIRGTGLRPFDTKGTTSACAENTYRRRIEHNC